MKLDFASLLFAAVAAGMAPASSLFSQKLPRHDLLLFAISKTGSLGAPQFLTAFNPNGYNNQPQFFSPTEIYLTAQMPADTTQTDIWALDLATRTRARVTQTREAEYSPTLMPGGKRLSCVRVEADGKQRLWSFPLDRSDAGRVVFPKIAGVGYHCWLSDTLAAMFIVGENNAPHTLVLAGLRGQKPLKIASNIGRSLHRLADGRLAFVQKATEQTWFIKTYDPRRQASEILVKTLPGSEDFAVLPDGSLLMGAGSKIYRHQPGSAQEWAEIADLSRFGVASISRLAASGGEKLAVVVQR